MQNELQFLCVTRNTISLEGLYDYRLGMVACYLLDTLSLAKDRFARADYMLKGVELAG